MNASARRELKAWGRAFGLLLMIAATTVALVVAGLATV